MTVEWKLPWCETSEQGLLSFALLASEWAQNAKDVFDTMLFRSKQEVEADLGPSHVSLTRLVDSAVETTESIFAGLLSQLCGDQGRCGCASVVAC